MENEKVGDFYGGSKKAKYGDVIDLEQYFPDGRLTEQSDGKRYEWHKMIALVKELGRPLTEAESEQFRIL